MWIAPARDLRAALAGLESLGERVERRELHGTTELMQDYLASYASITGSVYCDEQPLVQYHTPRAAGFQTLLGVFGTRRRNAWYLTGDWHAAAAAPAQRLIGAIAGPIAPLLAQGDPPCQQRVIREPNLHRLLPAFRLTRADTAPSITLGMVYAWDQERGTGNCSFHRMCLWEDGAVSLWIAPRRHLARLVARAVHTGARLPVSVNIGLAPHVVLAACCTEPDVSFDTDELSIAGALEGSPIELASCVSSSARCIARSEIVIEGSLGAESIWENRSGPGGRSIPEYLGYRRDAALATRLNVDVLSHRSEPIYQALTGPGREQSELLGIAQEVTVLGVVRGECAEFVRGVSCCPSGGGNLTVILQCAKRDTSDDARVAAVGRRVAESLPCIKHVYLVDDDVNPYSPADVSWAFNTRFRQDVDMISLGPRPGTAFDPTQSSAYASGVEDATIVKCVFDCTVPFAQRARFAGAFRVSEGWQ